jgi:quinol monooxygenase YgiN
VELTIFARFHAIEGHEREAESSLRDVLAPTRREDGCLEIHAYRATRDARLFFIHSRWKDEAAFERHATLPHTVQFLERIARLIDHPLDIVRTVTLA